MKLLAYSLLAAVIVLAIAYALQAPFARSLPN